MDRLSLRGLLTVLLIVATSGCSSRPLDTPVMAATDEASASFAQEAEEAAGTIRTETDALRSALQALEYAHEARLLEDFTRRFSDYRALDRKILNLAVENTNLRAHRLSIGPASQGADELRDGLSSLAPSSPEHAWHVQALAANAIASVREIQAMQAPHIAAAEDDAMTALERRMAVAETAARHALQALALSLGQRRMLTAACEESLQALQDALASRRIGGTR